MNVEERLTLPASRDAAWAFLWQVERVARCIPGCTDVQEVEPRQTYRAVFQDSVGPYKVRFEVDIMLVDIQEPSRIALRASGRDTKLGARQQVTLTLELNELGPSQTELRVSGDVEILGKIATLGQFVIKRKVKTVFEQFGQCVAREVANAGA